MKHDRAWRKSKYCKSGLRASLVLQNAVLQCKLAYGAAEGEERFSAQRSPYYISVAVLLLTIELYEDRCSAK